MDARDQERELDKWLRYRCSIHPPSIDRTVASRYPEILSAERTRDRGDITFAVST